VPFRADWREGRLDELNLGIGADSFFTLWRPEQPWYQVDEKCMHQESNDHERMKASVIYHTHYPFKEVISLKLSV